MCQYFAVNRIETLLVEKSRSPASLFVFPTDVAASRWADRLLELRGGAVAMEQFTAWDTFKEESIRSREQRRDAVPAVMRKVFAGNLLRENAEKCRTGEAPLFRSLVPPGHAADAVSYISWFSGLLPQLGNWYRRVSGRPVDGIAAGDVDLPEAAEERDLMVLTLRYREFLDGEGLFEPAWETPPFDGTGKECFIFFPGCLSDFGEYRELLERSPRVTLVNLEAGDIAEKEPRTFFYTNSRSEIAEAALYIRALAENEHIPWDDIVLSLPETGDCEEYVFREFGARNIPLVSRMGKPLASWPAGRLFSGLAECQADGFSFDHVAALLLNARLPWKDGGAIDQLVDFGMKNNCVSSWTEDGSGTVDVWLDAFASPAGDREKRAADFYRLLRQDAGAMNRAESFEKLLQAWFIFRDHFFDMDRCSTETDMVLSRCIAELAEFAEIEKKFPRIKVRDPFGIFAGHLAEKTYLPRAEGSGVSLLPYRTAAPAPFACHVVLGASQENLSAVFSRLNFLPPLRREWLGVEDVDASDVFIGLHRANSERPAAFFCAEESFSGFAIPHPALDSGEEARQRYGAAENGLFAEDPFLEEGRVWEALRRRAAPGELPPVLYAAQKNGFDAWRKRHGTEEAAAETLSATSPLLLSMIREKFTDPAAPGKMNVSATALAAWRGCSLNWLFGRVLRLENIRVETALMAENILGTVYHALLDAFFRDLGKTRGGLLRSGPQGLSPADRTLLQDAAGKIFMGLPYLPGEGLAASALTARILRACEDQIVRQTEMLLGEFCGWFGGFRVLGSELPLSCEGETWRLHGRIDCLLEDCRDGSPARGERAIVDFKLKHLPRRADCLGEGNRGDENFQLPAYISLAEKNAAVIAGDAGAGGSGETATALFFSILDAKPQVIFGVIRSGEDGKEIPFRKGDRIIRAAEPERFAEIMDRFSAAAAEFAESAGSGSFAAGIAGEAVCVECGYRRVCRTLYAVGRGIFARDQEAGGA